MSNSEIDTKPMTRAEAREHTDAIHRNVEDTRRRALELYERKGWAALGYPTWNDYVASEFSHSRATIYKQLQAALVEREIVETSEAEHAMSQIETSNKPSPIPTATLNALAPLPPGERKATYQEAVEAAPNGKPTAKAVKAVVDRKLGKPASEPTRERSAAEVLDSIAPSQRKAKVNGVEAPDPPDVAKLRASGRIPAEVVVEVDEPACEQPSDEPGDAPDPGSEGEAETPEAWLASLPQRARLTGRQLNTFDEQALAFRALEEARRSYAHHAARVLKPIRRRGPFTFRVQAFLRIEHPRHWPVCPPADKGGCGGSGEVPMLGECTKCRGAGFWIK